MEREEIIVLFCETLKKLRAEKGAYGVGRFKLRRVHHHDASSYPASRRTFLKNNHLLSPTLIFSISAISTTASTRCTTILTNMTNANGAVEDRAAFHLLGHPLPALIDLASTSGTTVDLFTLSLRQPILLFLYPSTSTPLRPTPPNWSAIPGALGCTPHLTTLSTHLPQLLSKEPELKIFGLSTQAHTEQMESKERLKLPFDLLSDEQEELTKALDIPTFEVEGKRYLRRMTLLLRGGQVTRVDYPIEMPGEAAKRAEGLLRSEQELMAEVEARDAAAAAAAAQAQA